MSRRNHSRKPSKQLKAIPPRNIRSKPAKTRPSATISDIIGPRTPVGSRNIRAKWRKFYNRLAALRADLVARSTNRSRDTMEETPSFSSHMADAGTDSYDRDFSLGMLSFEQDALLQIDQAMVRIRAGNYGICELTGKPIEQSRLEAIPWTRFSAAAEKQMEANGAFRSGRIGDRRSVAREEMSADEGDGE
jgi:RNA polymerase-binding transcription factor DksA